MRPSFLRRIRTALAVLLPALMLASPAVQADTYTYDVFGNLSTLSSDRGTRSFTYDEINRLKTETGFTGTRAHAYDANTNRTSDGATPPTLLTYTPASNRIATANGVTLTHDEAGNLLADGLYTYTWDEAGRLKTVSKNGTLLATYAYDHRNRRSRKSTTAAAPQGAQTILYHYDQDDHLIAETRSDGTPLRTYVWLAERPLTVIEHAAVSNPPRSLHLQHDHLGTPRLAKNDAGVIQWRWDSDGYGTTTPTHDPDGDGKATVINLRFPGQYYDQESGLYYNWNRYYSPRLGRYLSPDPIGIEGGPNGYAYVEGNPLSLIDPDGLMGRGSGANGGTPTWGKGGPRPLGGSESGGFVPSKTYCGSGPNEPLVPDWLYGVNISKACYNHDICYDQCGKSKAQCDNDLRRDIERACNSAPSQQIRQECYRMARQYQWAVQSFASGAYDDAQKAGCCKK